MANQLNPYLSFDGNAREAMEFYKGILGGTLHVMTHGDSPMAQQSGPEMRDKVMHARLAFDAGIIMASDIPSQHYSKPSPMIQLSLTLDSAERAEKVFTALATGGQTFMPLQETFWAHRFGMLADKYGVSWMVNVEKPMTA